jgi:acetylornithine deacetylase/succinyl-diaminopimelate desuccinylase-like protein
MFTLRKEGDQLVGRGTYDMKFAAACFIAAAESLAERNQELDYAIMFSCDEEMGGAHGVKYLLNDAGYHTEICLLPDGATDWAVEEHAKGAWFVIASAAGKTAHGSRPWEGDNAVHKLLDFLQEARKLCLTDNPHEPSLVVSQLNGGEAKNQVPDGATAMMDIRFKTHEDMRAMQDHLHALAAKHTVSLQTHNLVEPSHLDLSLPQVKAWEDSVCEVTGRESVQHDLSLGASDAHYFTEIGIPTIVTRPRGGCPHGPEEWINEQDLYDFHAAIVDFIPRVALADKTSA